MLEELRIRNFAIIENLELEFNNGLNVITGETGAGKSIIVDAVELILGGKADVSMVRSGAEKAIVEGVFSLEMPSKLAITDLLKREELTDESEPQFVTLSRELRANGRSTARVNGITVSQEILRSIGDLLVDIHGQSEHLTLFNPPHHLDLLDRYADLMEMREALRTVTEHVYEVRREIRNLMEDEASKQRRAEMLRHAIEEIDAAELKPNEDEALKAERNRYSNSEQLAKLSAEAGMLLNGGDDGRLPMSAIDALARVAVLVEKLSALDPDLTDLATQADNLSELAQDLSRELADYAENIEYDPDRLNEIEERLELIANLRRKYGNSIQAILAYSEKSRKELDNIENSEERLNDLRKQEKDLLMQIGAISADISKVRKSIGEQLSKRVVGELKDLRMERTQFEVRLEHTPDPEGCFVGDKRYKFDYTGIDHVEFMMSANPGEPLRPLAKVASGGEAARIMLSLKRVLTQADYTHTLIFDEVDQGIGGRVGSVVGEKLWELTHGHQVLVVTHLPQLAGYADKHFHVRKNVVKDRTATEVLTLEEDSARVRELSEMLGATGEGSLQSAQEILDEARKKKSQTPRPADTSKTKQSKLL